MQPQGSVPINFPFELQRGSPANIVSIAHNLGSVALTFISYVGGDPAAHVVSRVILSPETALQLQGALAANLALYEQTFGAIRRPSDNAPPPPKFEGMN